MSVRRNDRPVKKNCQPTTKKEARIRKLWIRLEWNGFNAYTFSKHHGLSHDTVLKAINEERNGPQSRYIRNLIGKLPMPEPEPRIRIPMNDNQPGFQTAIKFGSANGGANGCD